MLFKTVCLSAEMYKMVLCYLKIYSIFLFSIWEDIVMLKLPNLDLQKLNCVLRFKHVTWSDSAIEQFHHISFKNSLFWRGKAKLSMSNIFQHSKKVMTTEKPIVIRLFITYKFSVPRICNEDLFSSWFQLVPVNTKATECYNVRNNCLCNVNLIFFIIIIIYLWNCLGCYRMF